MFKTDSQFQLGIEVIAEEEDGYIIGASADSFKTLKEKIVTFVNDNEGNPNKLHSYGKLLMNEMAPIILQVRGKLCVDLRKNQIVNAVLAFRNEVICLIVVF